VPSQEAVLQWLMNEDTISRTQRTSRLQLITDIYEEMSEGLEGVAFHGLLCKQAFEEARWSFVNGQFLSSVLLCQVVIDNTLRSGFRARGRGNTGLSDKDILDLSYQDVVAKAHELSMLSDTERIECYWLKDVRNPYVHHRPTSRDYIAHRLLDESPSGIEDFQETDAGRAIRLMFSIVLRRWPF